MGTRIPLNKDGSPDIVSLLPDWLRWLLFLPVAVIAAWATYFIVSTITSLFFMFFYMENFYTEHLSLFMSYMAFAFVFLWSGSSIVPRHNLTVCFILSLIYAMFLGGVLIMKFLAGEDLDSPWSHVLVTTIAGIVAIFIAMKYFRNEKEDNTRIII